MKKLLYFLFLITLDVCALDIRPVPWITEEAIIFLEKFLDNNPNAKILEFGCGASTLWFTKRTNNLVSVEHNVQWFDEIEARLKQGNNSVKLLLKKRPYSDVCDLFPDEYFDLILIDGRNRKLCIRDSIRVLKKGGILMLDNAERPFYQCAIKEFLNDWEFHKTVQTKPDSCNFWYSNWQTNWWIKPSG